MTPRSFWTILIKILGIYIIIDSISAIPIYLVNIYSIANAFTSPDRQTEYNAIYIQAAYLLITILIYGLVLYNCIFRTDQVIDKLKLDRGFEDKRFEFNIHRSTVLKIIIIITGGVLLIDSLPKLLSNILEYLQMVKNYNTIIEVPATKYIFFNSIEIFIGYFMLTCSRMIVNFIERKRRGTVADVFDE